MKNILIIVLGRFGRHAAMKLTELGHQVMATDIREDRVDDILPYVTNALIGDSTDSDFLESLGIEDFDVCIVAIGDNFQSSLETTSLLKELGAKFVVSRAARSVHEKFLLRNGADRVVYPERQLAEWTAIRYSSNHILDYIEVEGDYSIFEVAIPEKWLGKRVGDIGVRKNYGVSILALKKNRELDLHVEAETVLRDDSTLLVLGGDKDIHKCFHT